MVSSAELGSYSAASAARAERVLASTSATLSTGATAQDQLQLTPGSNYTGTVTFTCVGAPLNAGCQVPSLTIADGNTLPFTVTVTTSGPAHAKFLRFIPRSVSPSGPGTLLLVLLFALVLCLPAAKAFRGRPVPGRGVFAGAFVMAVFFALFTASGCGGGSVQQPATTPAPPPPVVTSQELLRSPSRPAPPARPACLCSLAPIQLTLTVQ
jgi:hypothetical protein